jgi:hypothetical protein
MKDLRIKRIQYFPDDYQMDFYTKDPGHDLYQVLTLNVGDKNWIDFILSLKLKSNYIDDPQIIERIVKRIEETIWKS